MLLAPSNEMVYLTALHSWGALLVYAVLFHSLALGQAVPQYSCLIYADNISMHILLIPCTMSKGRFVPAGKNSRSKMLVSILTLLLVWYLFVI